MILAALVALGIEKDDLIEKIKLLDISGFEIEWTIKDKSGIAALHAEVKITDEKAHRHLHQIEKIIKDSRLSENIKKRALEIFTKLAEAEAKVHGIDIKKVHFHEVGAMDAIIDVVGACVGFEILGIEKFVCSKIHVGSGFVKMAHGKFPVPPPAVAELLQNIPVYSTEIEGELITPTGAAIIATVCDEFGQIPEMRIVKTAYGSGTREYENFPNVLRLMLGEIEPQRRRDAENNRAEARASARADSMRDDKNSQNLFLIETNLDDISPEILGYVMERAFEIGALDCWFTPIQMKKNRPATMISILCGEEIKKDLIELLYKETSTLGVRISNIERNCLEREIRKVETVYGTIDVKLAKYKNKIVNAKPEYDQMREFALQSKKSLREIEREILEKINNIIEK